MALAGCMEDSFIEEVKEDSSGTETVRVILSSASLDTRSAKDGDIMNNLRIWLVKKGETKVKYYSSTEPKASTEEVVFENVDRGEYTMYIIANSDANSSYTQGSAINDNFLNATLPALTDNKPPFTDSNGMPMSLIQEIKVTAGTNYIEAELVRVCGKIQVTVHNRTADKKVYLSSVGFTGKNPSTGYLFFKDHEVPAGTSYGEFTSLSAATGADAVSIDVNKDEVVFEQYLYETGNIELGLDLKGALYPEDFSGTPTLAETIVDKWMFNGNATNTSIDPAKYYIIANASNQRYFLTDNGTTLTAEHGQGNDDDFLAMLNQNESNYLKYIWKFSSSSNPIQIQNYGTDGTNGRYLSIGNNTFGMSSSKVSIKTDINVSTRRFYYDGAGDDDYYIYYDSGIHVHSGAGNKNTNRGWYLHEIQKKQVNEGIQFKEVVANNFIHQTEELKYIDDFGAPVKLNEICRNQILDIHLNVFHSESTGKLYFEVNAWTTKDNKNTTFD